MADPSQVQTNNGTSTTASTAATFSAATAGNLLLLTTAADDYSTGSPSGWTQIAAEQQTFHGLNFWFKIAAGGETSVTYVIGSATRSVWRFVEFNNVTGFDKGSGTFTQASGTTQATPTLTPAAGRNLIVATVGYSSSSLTAFTALSWSSITLTAQGTTLGPLSNPQIAVGIGWTVADYTGANTVASTGTFGGQAAQARSAIIGSFAINTGGGPALPPELIMQTRRAY